MNLITDTLDRSANTDSTLIPALSERWSPRGFDAAAVIDEGMLTTVLERESAPRTRKPLSELLISNA